MTEEFSWTPDDPHCREGLVFLVVGSGQRAVMTDCDKRGGGSGDGTALGYRTDDGDK